MGINCSKLTVI